jgi:hypothetical protein
MAIDVTINGIPYKIPETGAQGWGEEMTGWCVAVTRELNGLITLGDIPLTSGNLLNNQASPPTQLIPGLRFDISTVKGAFVEYNILRTTNETYERLTETGMLVVTYNPITFAWDLARYSAGDAGIEFAISNVGSVGQAYYSSTNLTGAQYSGTIRFRARVIK